MTTPDQSTDESENAREERHRCAERRHWTFEKIGGSIALLLTFVAAVGAILSAIAGFRAYDAANQAVKTALEANQISIRPYIKVKFEPETFVLHKTGDGSGDLKAIKFLVQNVGKLPGLASIISGATWNGRGHQQDEKHIDSLGVVGRVFLFPENEGTEFTSYELSMTKGNIADLADGARFYVMVDVLYGPSKNIEVYGPSKDFETKVCTVYRVTGPAPGSDAISLTGGDPCSSEGSNYAK
jgi:hypothetical protein